MHFEDGDVDWWGGSGSFSVVGFRIISVESSGSAITKLFIVLTGTFFLHHRVQTGSGTHRASYADGIGALSLGVKWPGPEADSSPPSSADIKNA
jgi:hypothetical protein